MGHQPDDGPHPWPVVHQRRRPDDGAASHDVEMADAPDAGLSASSVRGAAHAQPAGLPIAVIHTDVEMAGPDGAHPGQSNSTLPESSARPQQLSVPGDGWCLLYSVVASTPPHVWPEELYKGWDSAEEAHRAVVDQLRGSGDGSALGHVASALHAMVLGGVALMVLPSLIVGNELLILGAVGAIVGGWFLAHRHGQLRGVLNALLLLEQQSTMNRRSTDALGRRLDGPTACLRRRAARRTPMGPPAVRFRMCR